MGGGPSRSSTKIVPSKKAEMSDGAGGLAISCPPRGLLEASVFGEPRFGQSGVLVATTDGVDLIVEGQRVAGSRSAEAKRVARCLARHYSYYGELEAGRGTGIRIRYWMD